MGTVALAKDVSSSDMTAEKVVSVSDMTVSVTETLTPANEGSAATDYTYEIVPLLAPFNEYFLVKTDNPDPESFRFSDKKSVYSDESYIILDYDKFEDYPYPDVIYENPDTRRVKGGYIFKGGTTDGGEVTLQTVSEYDYWGDPKTYADTNIKITLPKLVDEVDYLINTYAKGNTFFDKMDAVQKGFSSVCLYSGSYIRGEVYRSSKYWKLGFGHKDQLFYILSPFDRKGSKSLFASRIYPFRYDSLGFPSMMASVSRRLDSSSSYKWSSDYHWLIEVTYNGKTRTYGGQGHGEGKGLTKDKITRFYQFDQNDTITLEDTKKLLNSYAEIEIPDDIPRDDALTYRNICDTVGKTGAWTRISGYYSYLYQKDDDYDFWADEWGVGYSNYHGGSLQLVADTWIDGRYVDDHTYVPGAKFEDHPESKIMLLGVKKPTVEYDTEWKYDDSADSYKKVYKNVKVTESTENIIYKYKSEKKTWEASDYELFAAMTEQGAVDKKYADALQLTYEEVLQLDVDKNTDVEPDKGYIYNGSAAPGTRFDRSPVNTDDPVKLSQLFAKAKAIAAQKGLSFTLKKGNYGMCGESMYWVYLKASKTLIITGTGDMFFIGGNPWYDINDAITHVYIGNGVQSISDNAFSGCKKLEMAELPNSVISIGEDAFKQCTSLASLTIPNSVTSIGEDAFYGCTSLPSLTIPNSVTSIGEDAFSGCNSLKEVTFIGTQAQWDALLKKNSNTRLENKTVRLVAPPKPVSSIAVKKLPTKMTYTVGEKFAPAGMVLKVTYTDGTTKEITSGYTYTPTGALQTVGQQTVAVSYEEAGVTKSTGFKVTVNEKPVSSVVVSKLPTQISYTVGEPFHSAGLKLRVTYSDNTTKEITSGFTCTPTKLNTVGKQKIVVSYGGKSTGFYVTVNVKQLRVSKKPTKTVYVEGDTLNTSGMKVSYACFDGSLKEITSGFTCTPTKLNTVGTQWITVKYGGQSTAFPVSVKKVTVNKIRVTKKPSKTNYVPGNSLNTSGMELTVTYTNNVTKVITGGFTCTPTKLTKEGLQWITVRYGNTLTAFPVTVVKQAQSIRILQKPTKTTYVAGNSISTAGLKLRATYADGSTKDVTSGFTCKPTQLNTIGTQWITVIYAGQSTAFPVKVEPRAKTLRVTQQPSKKRYIIGDTLNTSGMKVTATYEDGTSKTVTSGFACTPVILTTEGTQWVTVIFGGQSTAFPVTVTKAASAVAVKKLPAKRTYQVGESFLSTGMVLKVTYADGTTKEVTSGYTCMPAGKFNTKGQQKIIVSYGGKSTGFYVTVS